MRRGGMVCAAAELLRTGMVLAVLVCLCGCKTTGVVERVPVYVHDTTELVREVHDSTYIDRWHTVYVEGDTVVVRDSVVLMRWRERTDTAYVYVEKPVEVEREVAVVAEDRFWTRKRIVGMIIAVCFLIFCGVFYYKKVVR